MTSGSVGRVPVLLAAATLVPICALTWLAFRTLQQDRDLERQHRRERLELAAGRLAIDIDQKLRAIEESLSTGAGIRFSAAGVTSGADAPVLYQPGERPAAPANTRSALAVAEVQEFRRRDLAGAAASYRAISTSDSQELRGAGLLGLGRVLHQRGDTAGALRAFNDLVRLGSVPVAGQPAALVGHQWLCKLFEATGDAGALRRQVVTLAHELGTGAWTIDKATFELYLDLIARWGGPPLSPAAITRTEITHALWRTWRRGELPPRGRRVIHGAYEPVVAVWSLGPAGPAVWLAAAGEIETAWRPMWESHALDVALADTNGMPFFGERQPGAISLTPAETGLPFILGISSADGGEDGVLALRRALLVGGMLGAIGLTLAAAYGAYRMTARELLLARQQSDFVSAVSHEFRTPITSMRHLTELLASGSVASEERRAHYYGLLARETERLHRMVESLLSFGRIEAGAYAWRLEPTDVRRMVSELADDFGRDPAAMSREVLCDLDTDLPAVAADREALARAVWNLLENAAKYSHAGTEIRVSARRSGASVLIAVSDRGAGIAAEDQPRIFGTFVRGLEATRSGIRGVGIGLALVRRIAEAHGGSVRLESTPGLGSTFTLVLPCHES